MLGVPTCLAAVAATIAFTTAVHPTVLPICFTPERTVVCATGEVLCHRRPDGGAELLLMRGQFVYGLSNLDTSAQIRRLGG